MPSLIKLKSQIVALSNNTPNTVYNATVVRLAHDGAGSGSHTITLANTSGPIGSFDILAMSVDYIQKAPTDTLIVDSGSDVTATSIAFAN